MKSARKGFTLIELLVVISIIAILSVIGMTVFTNVQKSARDAKRRRDIDAITKALEIYKLEKGSYPAPPTIAWSSHILPGMDDWTVLGTKLGGYIQTMPIDPQNIDSGACDTQSTCHLYHYCSDGTYFILAVNLEGSSTQTEPDRTKCPTGASGLGNYYWKNNQQ